MITATVDISTLPPRLVEAIREIERERGADRPLALDDLVALRDVSEEGCRSHAGEGGGEGPGDAMIDAAIGIPGAVLHRPTYGARLALMRMDSWRIPEAWVDLPHEWVALAAAFVLAHARQESVCAALATEEQGTALIEAWGSTLQATPEETSQAVHRLLGDGYPPLPPAEKKKETDDTPPTDSEPTRRPLSYARLSKELAEQPATGSGKSPKRTSAG